MKHDASHLGHRDPGRENRRGWGRCSPTPTAPAACWAGRAGVMAEDAEPASASLPGRICASLLGEWRRAWPAQRFGRHGMRSAVAVPIVANGRPGHDDDAVH